VRHAVSIDERRAFFRQNLFGPPQNPQQDVQEVWFAGVHSDVGGSYQESDSQLSQIALRWMLCEAALAGVRLDSIRMSDILGGKPPYVAPDYATRNQHESLSGLWWIAELWPKIVHRQTPQGTWEKSLSINLGHRRRILPGSIVHESVEQRIAVSDLAYKPSNLPTNRYSLGDRCDEHEFVH
jgi:uncharacterized protein (DUF2235 family)